MKLSGSIRVAAWAGLLLAWSGCSKTVGTGSMAPSQERLNAQENELGSSEVLITLLGTNDVHGAVQPDSPPSGGLLQWGAYVRAIRAGLAQRLPDRSGVLVLDAGDQFQGTLLSNFNEGSLVFDLMSAIGYDGVVPGNHDYDFGPKGWLIDKPSPGSQEDPKEVIRTLARRASFPLLSANTYLKASLQDAEGQPIAAPDDSCAPRASGSPVAWGLAARPDFIAPYRIREVAGVKVALIGLDNAATSKITTVENVSDLCFRSPEETYLEVRSELEGKADLFVLIIHDGAQEAKDWVLRLLQRNPDSVHAVFAGHTHRVESSRMGVAGVPILQSGANGARFGRVDLVFDRTTRKLKPASTRSWAGARVDLTSCDAGIQEFCAAPPVSLEGVRARVEEGDLALVTSAEKQVESLSRRKLGTAQGPVGRHRFRESAMSNLLADALRSSTRAQIAFVNTGGIRDDLPAGDIRYDAFFKVLPFNNHAVSMERLDGKRLIGLLNRSIATCGARGALMQSGLRVVFERDCRDENRPKARLIKVSTLEGEVLFDRDQNVSIDPTRTFQIATLDFLSVGGSGYEEFVGVPVTQDHGILRELLVEEWLKSPPTISAEPDGRWKELPYSPR